MDLSWIVQVARAPVTRDCIVLSCKVAAIAMPLVAVSGVGVGYLLGRYRSHGLSLLDFFVTLLLIFPPIVTGFLLLLALGRMCVRQKLWGKAQSYLEASLAIRPSRAAHLELARLFDQLERPDDANRHYRASIDQDERPD